jgi:hypothetical protein
LVMSRLFKARRYISSPAATCAGRSVLRTGAVLGRGVRVSRGS